MSPATRRRGGAAVLRPLAVALLGAGAVAAATYGPPTRFIVSGAPVAAPPASPAPAAPVVRRAVVCPGPETAGLDGASAAPGGAPAPVTVLAGSSPVGVPGVLPGAAGLLTVDTLPGAGPVTSSDTIGTPATARVAEARSVRLLGTQGQAATLSASQRSLVTSGDARALVTATCTEPVLDGYLVGGAGDPGAQEYVVLTNPGPSPVTVELSVLGTKGLARSATTGALAVPAGQRRVVLVDGLAPGEPAPVVHVSATGGPVAATLRTTWLDGIVPRGGDDAVVTTPARRTTVAAGVLPAAGALRVRVAAVEKATSVTVAVRRAGTPPTTRSLRLAARSTGDVVLTGLPAGAYAVDVSADEPVVAGTGLETRTPAGATDVGWSAATAPLVSPVGLPLVEAPTPDQRHRLVVDGRGEVAVTTVAADGATRTTRVRLVPGVPADVDLGAATGVWLSPQQAQQVRAAVAASAAPGGTPLLGVLPLVPRPQTIAPTVVEPRG